MKKLDNKGLSVIEVLIVAIVIALIGTVGWFVYNRQNSKTENKETVTSQANQQLENEEKTNQASTPTLDSYAGWKTYESENLKFTFKYPSDWKVEPNPNYDLVELKNSSGDSMGFIEFRETTQSDPESFWKIESFGQSTLESELVSSEVGTINDYPMYFVHTQRQSDKGSQDTDTYILLSGGKVAEFEFNHAVSEIQKQIVNSTVFKTN